MNFKLDRAASTRFETRPEGMSRRYDPYHDLVWKAGLGAWIWDNENRRYLDAVSGYSALNLGHCHPRIVDCLMRQSSRLHFAHNAESEERQQLERELARVVNDSAIRCGLNANLDSRLDDVDRQRSAWISTTGARAMEVAWKIAYAIRPGVLMHFDRSYHGRSLATAQISDTKRSDCWISTVSHHTIPFPVALERDGSDTDYSMYLEPVRKLLESRAHEISAVVLEPAIGSRGYYFAPNGYHRALVKLVRSFGVLVISDEIQMGLGRLGGMFASHQQGWEPDLLVVGKSLGAGILPVSAVIGQRAAMDRLPSGIESETYAAQPLACRVGLEVLDILQNTDCIETSSKWHGQLRNELRRGPLSVGLDGEGSATVIDFQRILGYKESGNSSKTGLPFAHQVALHLRSCGVLVHLTGPNRDRIAIIPPLLVDASHLEYLLKAFACM